MNNGDALSYNIYGVVSLQSFVDNCYTMINYPNVSKMNLSKDIKSYPILLSQLGDQLPILLAQSLIWAFIPEIIILMINLVGEKQEKVKESK